MQRRPHVPGAVSEERGPARGIDTISTLALQYDVTTLFIDAIFNKTSHGRRADLGLLQHGGRSATVEENAHDIDHFLKGQIGQSSGLDKRQLTLHL